MKKVNKEFVQKPVAFFKNSSLDFLENERRGTLVERGFVEKTEKSVESVVSKQVVKEPTAQKPAKLSSHFSNNFLENERYHTLVERGFVEKNIEKDESEIQHNAVQTEEARVKTPTIAQTQQRFVFSAGSLKRYVTTCYFQPKQIPEWYSETMILNIGSSKKRFFESVYYKNKLLPHKWSESMHTTIKSDLAPISASQKIHKSEVYIPIQESPCHYISLEPQQKIAENLKVA